MAETGCVDDTAFQKVMIILIYNPQGGNSSQKYNGGKSKVGKTSAKAGGVSLVPRAQVIFTDLFGNFSLNQLGLL